MQREYIILSKGSPTVPMPIVVEKDDDNVALVMTYIPGENLCDLLNHTTTSYEEKSRLMKLLAEWFAQFHTHYRKDEERYIRGDAIMRNFIFSDKIWGVDFEEARKGKPIEDIACLVASYLCTDPMFSSEKFRLCTQFISSYESIAGCALLTIADETAYALLQRIQWRQNDEELLRTYAEHIRQNGIVVKEVAGNQML
jgi:tRNA A-37 threonylcarbamoyl transferase component Bud32